MTEVIYNRGEHRLTLKGHAQAGEAGKDVVCSAMTILAYTYAQACIDAVEFKCAKKDIITRFEPGDIEVQMTPHKKYEEMCTAILDSICNGYILLANKFRDNLTFKII